MRLRRSLAPMQGRLLAIGAGLALLVGLACSERQSVYLEEGSPGGFGTADAGADAAETSLATPMCAVTTCSGPWATCPSSEFPCDVNLLTDDDNCGGCGIRCGGVSNSTVSKWTCVDGACVFSCAGGGWRNCDDDPSNGCEASITSDPGNCGSCGKQCRAGETCDRGACVDECALYRLPDTCDGTCTDTQSDDANCGTCGTVCDPTGNGKPALASGMHYGCVKGVCDVPKCTDVDKADCNGNLGDGCEATIHSSDHCTGCGDACPAGKICGYRGEYRCICDDGETLCGGFVPCRRLDDDPRNCGGCNYACPGIQSPHFIPTCSSGICGGKCEDHHADCDGIADNGCEVNTRVDNRNCGACGNACAKDQVCSEGRCLVAPCGPGEGQATQ